MKTRVYEYIENIKKTAFQYKCIYFSTHPMPIVLWCSILLFFTCNVNFSNKKLQGSVGLSNRSVVLLLLQKWKE
jgi:hypothetical protein